MQFSGVVNALAQCTSALSFEENVSHSFLIESCIDYQARTGVNILSKWPTIPAALGTAPDTLQLHICETQQQSFVACSRLGNEVKRLLQAKFLGMLNVHFTHRTKYLLPPLMRAHESHEKICTKVHSAPRAIREQIELI